MHFILTVIILFSAAYGYDFDKLLNEALEEVENEKALKHYNLSLKSFNENLYNIAIKHGEIFLSKNKKDIKKIDDIVLLLSASYLKTKNSRKIFNLFLRYINFPISKDTKLKLFADANNLFIEKKEWKRLRIIRKKAKFLLRSDDISLKIENPVFQKFDPDINIFKLKEKNIIGKNSIYIAKSNTTLIEIAKKLDMGYDELKIANPHVDPFDIIKGQILFIPRRRLLPVQDFEFGTIYLNLSEKRLYYPVIIDGDPFVITFPVGIGVDNSKSPVGEFKITQKKEHPEWVVPKSIREEDPSLPPVVPPGPDNPLGTRAMRLGYTDYLLHGTSKRFGIGMKVSHGCIRMYNRDVERLFDIVPKGTKVVIVEKDFKIYKNSRVYLEIFDLDSKDKQEILQLLKEKGINTSIYKIDFYSKEKRGYAIPLN